MKRPNWTRYQPCSACAAAAGARCINMDWRPKIGGRPKAKPHAARRVARPALPPSHMRVLRLVARGLTDGAVAAELGLSPNYVPTVVKRLRARIGAYDRQHAVEIAQAKGLLP